MLDTILAVILAALVLVGLWALVLAIVTVRDRR